MRQNFDGSRLRIFGPNTIANLLQYIIEMDFYAGNFDVFPKLVLRLV
jgi:hypothetical protein